jgi:hypothetical protein
MGHPRSWLGKKGPICVTHDTSWRPAGLGKMRTAVGKQITGRATGLDERLPEFLPPQRWRPWE